jgi:hypothetical protein
MACPAPELRGANARAAVRAERINVIAGRFFINAPDDLLFLTDFNLSDEIGSGLTCDFHAILAKPAF